MTGCQDRPHVWGHTRSRWADLVREQSLGNPVIGGAASQGLGRNLGVLIVDDDESERELIGLGLEDFGFKPFLSGSGFEAIKLYPRLRDRITAVILDLKMPGLDGFDTLIHLRSLDSRVRVYILSGHLEANDEEELRRLGATNVFCKPIPLSYLASILRQQPSTG